MEELKHFDTSRFLAGLCVLCTACGGAQTTSTTPELAGAPSATPSMECLPSATDELSETMRFAWLLTEQSFELEAPQVPSADAPTLQVQDWSTSTLGHWVQQKTALVRAAEEELDEAAEETHPQRTMAGALVALMHEDIARVMLQVPVPHELLREPEIAQAFRDVIESQARPYLEHARRAYRACALNGRGHGDLSNWKTFCEEREERLPETRSERLAVGTTVEVEIIED